MEQRLVHNVIHIVKFPLVFLFYALYMIMSVFFPSKYITKLVNIEAIEKDMNYYFNRPTYLKLMALIITIVVYFYMQSN